VHDLRRRADAVLVGSRTVVADDPLLTFRTPGLEGDQPLRVVLDSSGRTPRDAQVFNDHAPTLLITPDDVGPGEGGVDLRAALALLGERGLCHVLVEAGPTLAGSFLEAGLVDRLVLYVAPKIIGGDAPGLFTNGVKTLTDAWSVDVTDVRRVGDDICIEARVR
jgi:diaminohydroxyphosphoribosylaminopyrimidine deaminase/5-amino-6-(5-phosphoribosylamino)uracil reductase